MSYKRHLKTELQLINETEWMYDKVCILLDTLDKQGHSGGSMSIFQNAIDYWSKDVFPVEEPSSLLHPLWVALKEIPQESWPKVLEYFRKTTAFIPFSPLTGEDDEWIHHDYGEDSNANYQNKRDGKVFKSFRDGVATRLDMELRYYPTNDYSAWYMSSLSGPISFPFDPERAENQPVRRYFRDESYSDELPEGIDSTVWLDWQYRSVCRGLVPRTVLDPQTLFVYGQDHIESVCRSVVSLLCYLRFKPNPDRKYLTDLFRWLGESDGNDFTLEWNDPHVEPHSWFEHFEDSWKARIMGRLLALLPDDIEIVVNSGSDRGTLFFHQGVEHTLSWEPVAIPTKHYQDWDYRAQHGFVPVFVPVVSIRGTFFKDNGRQINGDEEAYLYQKRREHGYAHPRNKPMRDHNLLNLPMAEAVPLVDVTRGGPGGVGLPDSDTPTTK